MLIDLTIHNPAWEKAVPDAEKMAHRVADAIFSRKELAYAKGREAEVSIVLADDVFIRQLNAAYRRQDKPTNVLSFPSVELTPGEPWPAQEEGLFTLGDVILALETIEREAKEQEKLLKNHFCHLLTHGILHLLGYDHQEEAEAAAMETLEVAILQSIGITNPYDTAKIDHT